MVAANRVTLFLYGALGGMLPTIATLASTFAAAPNTPWPASGLYIALAGFALVGGTMAFTTASQEIRHAIFAGIAAPAIITNIISGAAEANMAKRAAEWAPTAVLAAIGIGLAHAQGTAPASMGAGSTEATFAAPSIVVTPRVTGGVPSTADLPVTAEVNKEGKVFTVKMGTISDFTTTNVFVVPEGASNVFVSGQPVKLTGELTKVDLTVRTKPTPVGDFLWALGAPRKFSIEGVNVVPTP